MALPAKNPPVHAAWKLNPPVIPSIFRISPAKYRFGQSRLWKDLKSISFKIYPTRGDKLFLEGALTGDLEYSAGELATQIFQLLT